MPESRNRAKGKRRLMTIDAETDPFDGSIEIEPFLWGAYDGERFDTFGDTQSFVEWLAQQNAYVYAHNGGRFDFHFLLPFIADTFFENDLESVPVRVINGRIVEVQFGKAKLRDSVAILPIALSEYKKDEIEIWKLDRDHRYEYAAEIHEYLRGDCVYLYELVNRFRNEAGKRLTIAGNGIAFAQYLEIDTGRTNFHFDEKFRPFYYGGRCQACAPGEHHDVRVFDIKSAYPFAMEHAHATGSQYTNYRRYWRTLTRAQLQRSFITVECHSRGAFPKRRRDGLDFPHGFDRFNVTGWEFVAALDHELITRVNVIDCLVFEDTIDFRAYTSYWFKKKEEAEREGDKAQRLIAKIMLNSLYGKLCQDPTRYARYEIHRPETPPDDGWSISHYGEHYNLHKKSTLDEYREKWGEEWITRPVYYNVATGASITGFCRAMLLDAACKVGRDHVLYMDTDSLMVDAHARTDQLRQDGALGSWELETSAHTAWIAGKKLYALEIENTEPKVRSKGVRLALSDLRTLCRTGEPIRWRKDAPTFAIDGSRRIMEREIRPTCARPK